MAVGIAHDDPDDPADIGTAERVSRLVQANIDETAADVALPLIMQRPQTIGVGQCGGVRRQHLILDSGARDRRPAGVRSLTLAMAAVDALVAISAKPWLSV